MATKLSDIISLSTPSAWWGEKWREGLFSGNGIVGANVYGGSMDERIVINHVRNRWLGKISVVPDISLKVKKLRILLDNGQNMTAQSVMGDALASKHFKPHVDYMLPIGELVISMLHNGGTTAYDRRIDMSSGEVEVSYQANATTYTRRLFVSRANDMVVYQLSKQGSVPISADFTYSTMHPVNANTKHGICPIPEGVECKTDKDLLYFATRNDEEAGDFGVVSRFVVNGGMVKGDGGVMHVVGCNSVTIISKVFVKGNRGRDWQSLSKELLAVRDGYDKMLRAHTQLHGKIYKSTEIELSSSQDSVQDMLQQSNSGATPAKLLEKLYKVGRYYMVSATGDKGRPLSPVGLWNGSYKAYKSSCNYGGEMQMSYLHTINGNLMQDVEYLFDKVAKNVSDYQNNAIRLFGCNGYLVPSLMAPMTGRLGSTDTFVLHYTGAGAWLCNYYFKYYRATGNTKFLKSKLLPFAYEIARFYQDFLTIKDGKISVSPSPLPLREGEAGRIVDRPVVAKDSTLDLAVLRHFMSQLIDTSKSVKMYTKDIPVWQDILMQIPDAELSSDGIYKEFVSDNISVDYSNISMGTLYGAYFSNEVDFTSDQETIDNYERTADSKRQACNKQNSLYMAVLACVYARLGNADKALQCINSCVRGCITNNLVFVDKDWRGMGICGSGTWAPVQMNTNMVIVQAIQQMLMYSYGNNISILHCVPKSWDGINVQDMLTDNGVVVSFECGKSDQLTIKLTATKDTSINLYMPIVAKKYNKKDKYKIVKQYNKACIQDVQLVANKTTTIVVRYAI